MTRRALGVVIALVLAAVGTWIIVRYVQDADERALEGIEVVDVLVVDRLVARGTPTEELAGLVSIKQVPSSARVPDSLQSLEPVSGLVTAADLVPGEQVLASRFVRVEALRDQRDIDIPPGLLEVTFAISPERAVGGVVSPGDLVAFVASFAPFSLDAVEPESTNDLSEFLDPLTDSEPISLRTPNTTHLTIHKALVTRVQLTSSQGQGLSLDEIGDVSVQGQLLVTLAVDASQVERVVFAAEYGSIWLALEQEDSNEEGTDIITRGNVYR